ncbi:excalibur calcium-binding domain-containing protein [Bifidobacterium pseudolongum]|uniref:excalibur calcium-binding domain-containing protein n=1 Tax=Bifidobacterium pseudolongum TaxID=1694 RepID=UPI00101F6AFE|nr:excalibur calcium-binding domain-containing protein [Bifidobacterium pseudolongum]RYQ05103.1 calcium-binding protein [Bifidobacterium pseudolongum subsp. globosum]
MSRKSRKSRYNKVSQQATPQQKIKRYTIFATALLAITGIATSTVHAMHETQWQTPQPLIAEAPRAIVADVEEKEVDEGAFTPEEEQVILSAISGTRTAAAAIDALNERGFYPLAITSNGVMEPIGPEESIDYILTDPLQYETKVSGSRIVYLYVTENTDVEDALNKFDTLPQQLSAVKELGYTVSIANAANYDDGKPDEHPDRYQMSSDAPQIDRRANTVTLYATPLRSESEIEAERKAEEEARKQAEAQKKAEEEARKQAEAEAAERARQQAAAEEAQRRAQAEAEARAQQQAQQQTQGKSHYRNCKDVWETLGHGITSDDPGHSRKLDRDGDGFACEIRPSY